MLYKEELKKVPLCKPPKVSKEELKDKDYIAGSGIVDLKRSGKTLIIDYYSIENQKLQVRFFSDGENFTVYNVKKSMWSKSFVNTILYRPRNTYDFRNIDVVSTKANTDMAGQFLNKTTQTHCFIDLFGSMYNYRSLSGILGVTDKFIKELREEAKLRSEEKAAAIFRERRSWVPKPNYDTDRFCNANCFKEKYIFFSNLKSNKKRECYCSSCHSVWEISEKPKHKSIAECPHCKAKAIWWSDKYQSCIDNKSNLCTVCKHENDLCLMWNKISRTFCNHKPYIEYCDDAYTFYINENGECKVTSYFYTTGYNGLGLHWAKEHIGETCYHPAFVYTGNLKDVFGAKYYNVDLSSLLDAQKEPINFIRLLDNLKTIPSVEYVCKLGLLNLASQLDKGDFNQGQNFEQVLGISNQYIPLYQKYNVTANEHRFLRKVPHYVSEDLFLKFKKLNLPHYCYDNVLECCRYQRLDTLCDYIQQKQIAEKTSSVRTLGWLKDYYSLSENMDIPITKNNVRPKELKKAHDLLTERYNKVKADIKDKKSKAALELVNKWFKKYEKNGYCVKVPNYRADFIKEGQALNHCVGDDSYYKAHIQGTSMIFFIRKIDKPDVPYVTAEIDMISFRVKQCYGVKDSMPKREVLKFVNEFCQWIKYHSEKLERKAG